MKIHRKKRLIVLSGVLAGIAVAVALIFTALGQNMNHYYSVTQIKSDAAPIGKQIRLGGMVQMGSIKRGEKLKVSFAVTDYKSVIDVNYDGILPDLFREGQGVMATGKLVDKNHFVASEILAKHDEKYMPKEVKDDLAKQGIYPDGKPTSEKPTAEKSSNKEINKPVNKNN